MTRWPRISVVTPNLNQGEFLELAILSVLRQEYPNLEYSIIDGGSSDCSADIIKQYRNRLAYSCSECDSGQAAALQKGFAQASGDILCWLNADDIYLPGTLRTVGEFFDSHPTAEVLNGGAFAIDETGRPFLPGFWTYSEGVSATYDRLRWYGQDGVFQQATFWRRTAYEAVGGIDPSWYFIMDKDLFVRLAQRQRFQRIPEMLACFRLHGKAKTARAQHIRATEERQFRIRYQSRLARSPAGAVRYAFYRAQSLARKAGTALPAKLGLKRLPPAVIEPV